MDIATKLVTRDWHSIGMEGLGWASSLVCFVTATMQLRSFFVINKTNEIYKECCTVKHSSHYGSRYYNLTFNIEMTTPICPLGT